MKFLAVTILVLSLVVYCLSNGSGEDDDHSGEDDGQSGEDDGQSGEDDNVQGDVNDDDHGRGHGHGSNSRSKSRSRSHSRSHSRSRSCERIHVTEHVWVNDTITEQHHIRVSVPSGSKLYDVMVKAAAKNRNFKFESIVHPTFGHFITKIGNDAQVPAKNKYWLIFITDNAPRKSHPPGRAQLSPLGVSSLVVKDGKHYLFWLRTANLTHT